MPNLSVGGVTIPVAPGGASRDRLDMMDRARAFDGTYRASATGNPKREWHFSTPPVSPTDAYGYEIALTTVIPQVCSGDLLGDPSNQVSFSEALNSWTPRGTSTVTPNVAVAPDGTLTADQFNPVAASGYIVANTIVGDAAGRTFTASIWLQSPVGARFVTFGLLKNGDAVEISTQVIATPAWQRFSVTGTAPTASTSFYFYMQESNGLTNPWNTWGADLKESSVVGPYNRTTGSVISTTTISCYPELTGRTPIKAGTAHRVVLDFVLRES